jgi:hypothetical protein
VLLLSCCRRDGSSALDLHLLKGIWLVGRDRRCAAIQLAYFAKPERRMVAFRAYDMPPFLRASSLLLSRLAPRHRLSARAGVSTTALAEGCERL